VARDEAVELLAGLVAIPSPSGDEGEAAAFLVDWMARRGLRARVDEAGNAVGEAGDGPREILLLGHIDTVPGSIPVRREGDVLHGRGTVDAKGPLCAFAAAAVAVAGRVPAGWRVAVVGAVEEEASSSRGARHVVATRGAPAACVIGEPSRWDRVTLGYKGRLGVRFDLRSPLVHSAGRGRLPAEWGVALWRRLEDLGEEAAGGADAGEFHRLTPSLLAFRSDDDGAFGRVSLSVAFRLPPAVAPADLEDRVRAAALALAEEGGIEIAPTFSVAEPAFRASKRGPLVPALLRSIREEGGEPSFVLKTGTSDMNVVGPAWPRTPIAAYGPGDSALDHTPEERIDLGEFRRAVAVVGRALEHVWSSAGATPPDRLVRTRGEG